MKDKGKKIARLEKREEKLVAKGHKAVDEGREKKADRVLGRAAKTENKLIKTKEKAGMYKYGGTKGKTKKVKTKAK